MNGGRRHKEASDWLSSFVGVVGAGFGVNWMALLSRDMAVSSRYLMANHLP